MFKRRARETYTGSLPKEVFAVVYEAAEAEDRLRDLKEYDRSVQARMDDQLAHELGKLARKGIDTSDAIPPVRQQEKAKVREA